MVLFDGFIFRVGVEEDDNPQPGNVRTVSFG